MLKFAPQLSVHPVVSDVIPYELCDDVRDGYRRRFVYCRLSVSLKSPPLISVAAIGMGSEAGRVGDSAVARGGRSVFLYEFRSFGPFGPLQDREG